LNISSERKRRADLNYDNNKVFVDASRSEAATLYAIGVVVSQDTFICEGCLKCLKEKIDRNWRPGSVAAILAAQS